ncbi:multiprotein-bridging factor 1 family protein [Streptomyces kaempferi]
MPTISGNRCQGASRWRDDDRRERVRRGTARRRTAAGKSLGELAEEVHCSRSFLSRIETGQRRVTRELAQLCDERLDARARCSPWFPTPPSSASRRRSEPVRGSGPESW